MLRNENNKSDSFVVLSTFVHGCSLLIPAKLFREVGMFNDKLITTQDNEMWVRAIKGGYKLKHIPQKLISSRRHEKQGQITMRDRNIDETVMFYKWAIDYLGDELLPPLDELKSIFLKKGLKIEL